MWCIDVATGCIAAVDYGALLLLLAVLLLLTMVGIAEFCRSAEELREAAVVELFAKVVKLLGREGGSEVQVICQRASETESQ